MTDQVEDVDSLEQLLEAKALAAISRRPVYVCAGKVTAEKPKTGPFLEVWPTGDVTASGFGRKRIRRRRTAMG